MKNRIGRFILGRQEEATSLLGSIKADWPEMDMYTPIHSTIVGNI